MEFTSNTDAPRPAGELPYVTATQASALMRSAMAISNELFATAFGDAGVHARSAVGVAALPLDVPVEVEVIVALADD